MTPREKAVLDLHRPRETDYCPECGWWFLPTALPPTPCPTLEALGVTSDDLAAMLDNEAERYA